ncbi:hypothetical protein [Flavicella marina]|uniref:hypothetical protein n=1 Tax=Flavicella marina TaxID=1475951 RepID=UPI001264A3E5|nr:hypothetical protein [Flavicella marina]
MKKIIIVVALFFVHLGVNAQERFLTIRSKDSINGAPKFKSSFGANIKLNGYFDAFGGLQDSETFNVGKINVYGTDDSNSFKMDMYQTQLKFESTILTGDGEKVYAIVEFDFWGGNGHMRLRKAYVEFDHWQIGQGWASFGDEALWPNILEWEGPPSGVWVRSPHIKYFNKIGNDPDWRYIIALDAPITDYNRFSEIDPLVGNAHQSTPDVILGLKHEKKWGHLRASTIFRNINYKYNNEQSSFFGYGLSFSGKLKKNKNSLQFQGTVGKGITSYITSIAGFGYDGFPTVQGELDATPSIGGWAAYEHYWTPKLHTNFVVGYTRFYTNDVARFFIVNDPQQIVVLNGNVNHVHTYGIVNVMYDHYERMTYGLELDYGTKSLDYNGEANGTTISDSPRRDAMRISFGLMFYF